MDNDKTRQEKPSANQTAKERLQAVQIAQENPETVKIIEWALIKKWGEETGGQFSDFILQVSPDLIKAVDGTINDAFKDMSEGDLKNERIMRNWGRVKVRIAEFFIYRAFLAHLVNHIKGIQETQENFYSYYHELAPYLEKEMQKAPEGRYMLRELDIYDGLTLPEVMTLWKTGEATGEHSRLLLAAIHEADKAGAARDAEKAKIEWEQLPTVSYTNRPGIELTTDKLMTVFFGANAPAAPKGQVPGQMAFLPVKYEKTGAPEITLYYTYDFDNDLFSRLKLEKKIDDEDYFILSFIASYWRSGERSISVVKLYKDMTGDNPNNTQLTALTNRLIKIAGTNIFINDRQVRQAWGIEDEKKTYKEILTPLAPIKVGAERFMARGQVVEAGIEILSEPDIMKLGYEMGQYTTIPKNLLHVKKKTGRRLSRTPRFYRVLHFLIRRIASMKSGNLSAKILYDTFYSETGETTARGKQLARDCMYIILDHFKECDKWITGYREETTPSTGKVGVRIFCNHTTKK